MPAYDWLDDARRQQRVALLRQRHDFLPPPPLRVPLTEAEDLDQLALDEGFTGTIKDRMGREYHYVNGKRVASSHPDAGDQAHAKADARAAAYDQKHQAGRDDPKTVVQAVRHAAGATYGLRDTDRTEAMAAAALGHDWKHKSDGWDTRENASRWLGEDEARKHGNPVLLWDVKSDTAAEGQKAVGYDDKKLEAARKANEYQAERQKGEAVISAFVVVHRDGVYLHFGQDPESQGPTFGSLDSKSRRKIVDPGDIGQHIDGSGGPLPAVRLSSTVVGRHGEGLKNLTPEQVAEMHANIRTAMHSALEGGMDKLQGHLDKQAAAVQKRLGKEVGKSEAGVQGAVEANPQAAADALAANLDKLSDEDLAALEKAIAARKAAKGK